MAKSLQEQLLAAGLVDKKKAKKAAKEMKVQDHLQRTGQENQLDAVKEKAELALREKAARDRELNLKREQEAQAKAIALEHAGVAEANARFHKVHLDTDDGRREYDIEFRVGNVEYEYEIDAQSGRILDHDKDYDD